MAAQVFAFILHKDGKADDSALELVAAAKKIFPDTRRLPSSPARVRRSTPCVRRRPLPIRRCGSSPTDPGVSNAEIIQPLLLKVLPKGGVLLLPQNTFGMDLGPGLSVKMDAAYVRTGGDRRP